MSALNRSAARLAAVQALYQMDVTGKDIDESLAEFESHWIAAEIEGEQYHQAEIALFRNVVRGVLDLQRPIDRMIDDALASGWPLKRVEAVLRAVLRAATYELQKRPDIPARVVIKEYVDIAAAFFEREEAGMANAVLDVIARQLRSDEFEQGAAKRG